MNSTKLSLELLNAVTARLYKEINALTRVDIPKEVHMGDTTELTVFFNQNAEKLEGVLVAYNENSNGETLRNLLVEALPLYLEQGDAIEDMYDAVGENTYEDSEGHLYEQVSGLIGDILDLLVVAYGMPMTEFMSTRSFMAATIGSTLAYVDAFGNVSCAECVTAEYHERGEIPQMVIALASIESDENEHCMTCSKSLD